MAKQKIECELKWENENFFSFTAKVNGGEPIEIIKAEENGHISQLWSSIQKACEIQFRLYLMKIGREMMKSPSS